MTEQIISRNKRYESMRAFQKMTGISYKTLKFLCDTNQIPHVRTEAGTVLIDTQAVSPDISLMVDTLNEVLKKVAALCHQFNIAT